MNSGPEEPVRRPDPSGPAKYRLLFGYAICLASLLFARRELFLPGIGLAMLGIALRIWSAGHLHKDRRLATGGPYAFCRNPLYLGSFLLGLGGMIAIRVWWLLAVYVLGFFAFYYPTMRSEEEFLLDRFGDEFETYRKRVPLFLPLKIGSGSGNFSFSNVMRNKEYKCAAWSMAFLAVLEGVIRLRAVLGR